MTSQHLETNRLLWHAPGINIKFSGTTAVTAVLQPRGRLLIANVGDSAALLGRIDPSGRQVTAEALTTEHTPENAEEAERIKASGVRALPLSHPFEVNLFPIVEQVSVTEVSVTVAE